MGPKHFRDMVIVRYHCWWPSSSDPFYTFNSTENAARVNYYGADYTPHGVIDGDTSANYASNNWDALVTARAQVSSPLTIALTATYNSGNRQGTVNAHITNTSTGTVSGVVQFGLFESGCVYAAPNGEQIHNNLMRDMLPDANGQAISLAAGASLDTSRAFTVSSSVAADSSYLVCFVQNASTKEIYQGAKIYIPPDMPSLWVGGDSIKDGSPGDQDGRLDPGETADFLVGLGNVNPITATGVTATLATTDTFVTIVTGSASYSDIPSGALVYNSASPFQIMAKPTCPWGRRIPLTIAVTSNGGSYTTTRNLTINTGSPENPIGPDAYGYYTYEDLDTQYRQAPPYNWVEIDSLRGGHGTRVTLGDDQTVTRTMPFTMKHYGSTSATLSICSNGWVAVGSTASTSNGNTELPNTSAPAKMVAAYWTDLDPASSTGGGRVSIFSDTTNHRYIVEFDSVQIFSGNHTGHPQTFQYILYDPAYIPTPTGDGEVVLQYQLVNDPNIGTTGIQNNGGTIGITYVFNGVVNQAAYGLAAGRAIKFTTVSPTSVGVSSPPGALGPESPFALLGAWPNPFRGGTAISFSLPSEGRAHLAIYNVAGQLVRTLADGILPAGRQSISWDGRNNSERPLPGGIYFYRLSFGERTLVQKAVLIR
jgi:hypothetical protein